MLGEWLLKDSRGGREGGTTRVALARTSDLSWALKNAEEFSVRQGGRGSGRPVGRYERARRAQQNTCPLGP